MMKTTHIQTGSEFFKFHELQKGCIGFVDTKDSTSIFMMLSENELNQFYTITMNSLIQVAQENGGLVFKVVGDGFFFVIKEELNQNFFDKSIQCCRKILDELNSINNILRSKFLPSIHIRISLDYGLFWSASCKSSSSLDFIGNPLNVCCKINGKANSNCLIVGENFKKNSCNLKEIELKQKCRCKIGRNNKTSVYAVNFKKSGLKLDDQ